MDKRYDAIIIGGGVNGCGVARDLALRGAKILLLDKGDLSKGTSWASSGMIHGGIRYLLSDVHTTHKSCKDSGYIQNIGKHMIFRIPLIMPKLKGSGLKGLINYEGANALFSFYDKFQPLKGGKPHVRLTAEEAKRLEPMLSDKVEAAVSTDEWGIDVPRLCVMNAVDAGLHGADIKTWTEVVSINKDSDEKNITGVTIRDTITCKKSTVNSSIVVNCAGPWVPKVAKMAGLEVKLRPAKGIHLILDRRISNMGIIVEAIDGRSIFIIPHENISIIGTTDDDYYGDLDNIRVSEDEIEYCLQAIESVLPDIRKARIIKTIAGLRPTLYETSKYEDDLTRDHSLIDHQHEGLTGFITLAGGKLAAYRVMAEETADLVCKKIPLMTKCTTHTAMLPGGEEVPNATELAKQYGVDAYAISRMISRQGQRSIEILEMIKEDPALGLYICQCEPTTEAEIRYVIRNEHVRRATDLISRCRIAEGPCQGLGCIAQTAIIFGDELDLGPEKVMQEASLLLQDKWHWRRDSISDLQMAQEELYRMIYQATFNPSQYNTNTQEVF